MQLILDARTQEILRDDIVKYIAHCVDIADGMKNLASTKTARLVAEGTISVLEGIIKDIQNATLDKEPI